MLGLRQLTFKEGESIADAKKKEQATARAHKNDAMLKARDLKKKNAQVCYLKRGWTDAPCQHVHISHDELQRLDNTLINGGPYYGESKIQHVPQLKEAAEMHGKIRWDPDRAMWCTEEPRVAQALLETKLWKLLDEYKNVPFYQRAALNQCTRYVNWRPGIVFDAPVDTPDPSFGEEEGIIQQFEKYGIPYNIAIALLTPVRALGPTSGISKGRRVLRAIQLRIIHPDQISNLCAHITANTHSMETARKSLITGHVQ